MNESTVTPPTRARLLELVDELYEGWNRFLFADGGELSKPRDAEHPMTAAVVLALTSHVTETARAVTTLFKSGADDLVVIPLVRTAYETALTAHWLAQVPDATAAFINEDARSRKSLLLDLPKARGAVFRGSVAAIQRHVVPPLNTKSASQARSFAQMCEDLNQAGVDAYIYYRVACGLTHPSVLVADQYLERRTAQDIVVRGSSHPQGDVWLFLTASSVVWAQAAANFCDTARTRRNTLRRYSRELGIPPFLEVASSVGLRLSKRN